MHMVWAFGNEHVVPVAKIFLLYSLLPPPLLLLPPLLFPAHLSSPLPETRDHALQLISALALQSSDPSPLEKVMSELLTALKSELLSLAYLGDVMVM